MEGVGVDEIAVGGEAGIVPIFDMAAGHLVAPAIGALPIAARLVVAAVGKQLVPDTTVVGHPEADIGVLCHLLLLLCRCRTCFCSTPGLSRGAERCGHD